LEKKTIPIDNFSKPKLKNRRKHVKSNGIENTLNIWQPHNAKKVSTITFIIFGF
jgi:hypothetical protein